ncbi:MAG: protein kinase [Candidatus Eisenbacteria bacterium]|uniref:non-specific serine/threonine protein kinase n=1 Tax=Eiseniibacteriota bacterium TaxID=2212470 RepID=A0A933WBS6_UNCEI|nr:protein kinase [Candidatus Eisenbacteria bacterium]
MSRLSPGTRLGPYEIVLALGAGGMGEVYRARDSRLGRDVALKVLPEAVASDPDRLARFEREARTVAVLNHPNIVTLHSIEESDGVRFLTMELVEGDSLADRIPEAGLEPLAAIKWALALADALGAAHERGVVHRDLKPANVMISREGRVKVLDFGLAKLADSGDDTGAEALMRTQALTVQAPLSADGQVVGTTPYMAPEQIRGDKVDARTDLFAFGIVFYEMLTGRRPFAGRTNADVTTAILRDLPPTVQSVRAELPAALDRIVGRCLEKDAERRFASAAEVRAALAAARRALETHTGSSGSGAGAAAVAPSLAVLPFANMSADPENEFFSDGLAEELLNVLARNPGLRVVGRTSSFAFKGRQEDLREIGQKLGVATLLEGSVRKAGNRVRINVKLVKVSDGFHLWSETFDRVLDDIFAVQDEIANCVSLAMNVTLLGTQPAAPAPQNAETFELLLHAHHFAQQQSEESVHRAVELYRDAIARVPGDARAWAGLGFCRVTQYWRGEQAGKPEVHREAREAVDRAVALDPNLAQAWETMAMALGPIEFRWKEAHDAIRKAHALAPGNGQILMMLAHFEGVMGDTEAALAMSERALALDPLSANNVLNRGRMLAWLGRNAEAEGVIRRALELSPGISSGWAQLAWTLFYQGEHDEAEAAARKETRRGYQLWYESSTRHLLGDTAASDRSLQELLTLGDHWGFQIAMVHAARGEHDEAFRWLERSYELRDAGLSIGTLCPQLESIRSDARWLPFLRRIGLRG